MFSPEGGGKRFPGLSQHDNPLGKCHNVSNIVTTLLTLSGAGGGEKHPPSHTFAIP